MNPKEVVALIEGEPAIGVVPVEPGMTNTVQQTSRIVGLNTENSEINEGLIRFDIIFYVRMPSTDDMSSVSTISSADDMSSVGTPYTGTISSTDDMLSVNMPSTGGIKGCLSKIIINIEAQKDNPTSYKIVNRGIFYVSRLISSQKERDFDCSDYDDIKQVFSIWICMNMNTNSMSHIHLTEDTLLESCDWKGNLDLINIILIGITNELPPQDEKYKLHRLLSALFSQELDLSQKYDIIEKEYDIPLNDGLGKDVGTMCNLGLGIEERATEKAAEKFILNMYKKGFDIECISEMVELSTDEVKSIIEKNNDFALV